MAELMKEAMSDMPDTLDTKKEIEEYFKKASMTIKEKITDTDAKRISTRKPKNIDENGDEVAKTSKPLTKYQMFLKEQYPKLDKDISNQEKFTIIAELWRIHKKDTML